VFVQLLPSLAAGNRNDVLALVQQPGQRDLSRGDSPACGQLPHGRRSLHVGVEVLALVTRIAAAVVVLRIFLRTPHRPGQEPAAERREWDETDAELAQQRDDARLEVALP